MDKHTAMGVFVGGIFAATIASIAALDGLAAGGLVLLASVVFGLAAGLCIGGLIVANFAYSRRERKKRNKSSRTAEARHARRRNRVHREPAGRQGFILLRAVPAISS